VDIRDVGQVVGPLKVERWPAFACWSVAGHMSVPRSWGSGPDVSVVTAYH